MLKTFLAASVAVLAGAAVALGADLSTLADAAGACLSVVHGNTTWTGAAASFLLDDPIKTATVAISICALLCAGTPTPDPNSKLGRLYAVVELIGGNFGFAKDKGKAPGGLT